MMVSMPSYQMISSFQLTLSHDSMSPHEGPPELSTSLNSLLHCGPMFTKHDGEERKYYRRSRL